MKLGSLRLVLASFALAAAFAADAAAQFNQEQKAVYDKLLEAQELNDVREMERIAKRDKAIVEQIYDVLEGQMAYNDSIDAWEEIKTLASMLDQANAGNAWTLRMQFVSKMSKEQRQERADLRTQYGGLQNQIAAASKNRDKVALKEAAAALLEIADKFQKAGDPEYEAYALVLVAN